MRHEFLHDSAIVQEVVSHRFILRFGPFVRVSARLDLGYSFQQFFHRPCLGG